MALLHDSGDTAFGGRSMMVHGECLSTEQNVSNLQAGSMAGRGKAKIGAQAFEQLGGGSEWL